MKEVLEHIIKQLVVDKDAVKITEDEFRGKTRYTISVAPGDYGKVIGKGGNVITSIRTLMNSIAMANNTQVIIHIT